MSCFRKLAVAAPFSIALIVSSITPALAQNKMPVRVSATIGTDDQTGHQLAFELREAIRGSQRFRLVDAKHLPFIRLSIVTLKVPTTTAMTAASLTFAYDSVEAELLGYFITSSIHTCGRGVVRECARSALASLDDAADQLKGERNDFYMALQRSE